MEPFLPHALRTIGFLVSALYAGALSFPLATVALGRFDAEDFLLVVGMSLRAGIATWSVAVVVFLVCCFVGSDSIAVRIAEKVRDDVRREEALRRLDCLPTPAQAREIADLRRQVDALMRDRF